MYFLARFVLILFLGLEYRGPPSIEKDRENQIKCLMVPMSLSTGSSICPPPCLCSAVLCLAYRKHTCVETGHPRDTTQDITSYFPLPPSIDLIIVKSIPLPTIREYMDKHLKCRPITQAAWSRAGAIQL